MKTQNIIIAVIAILVIAGIAIGVYFATKGDSTSPQEAIRYTASNGTRSGSLLERLDAEIKSGAYDKKGKNGEAPQEGVA